MSDWLVSTTPVVHCNTLTPFSAFICNTNTTFQKKEGQEILYFVIDITFTVFSKHDNLSKKSRAQNTLKF